MKTGIIIGVSAVAIVAVAGAIYMIDVDQTEEAQLPEISIEGGQMPEFEATTGDVEVVEETMTVEVPEVDVTTREEEVDVPVLDIQPPEDTRAAESVEDAPARVVQ